MSRKNVIILHADQLRFDGLACNGNRFARTPNLDRMAKEGIVFTRHVSANPICSPSRASLVTGLYPPGHNVWCNGVALNRREYARINPSGEHVDADADAGFCPEPPTMADCFAGAGYDTATFGKLHLTPHRAPDFYGYPETFNFWAESAPSGAQAASASTAVNLNDWHGPYYGFRHVEMTEGHGEKPCFAGHYAQWLRREHPEIPRQIKLNAAPRPLKERDDVYATTVPFALHNTSWLADRLCDYILHGRPADRPFFAFVGFPDPHHPFAPCRDIVPDFEGIPVHAPRDPDGRGQAGSPVQHLNQRPDGPAGEALRVVIRYTYAMVYQIDLAVGRILDALDASGLARDTIVAFTSDHGDYMGDHGCIQKGFGASDSLLRVPFLLRAPAGAGLPARFDGPMSNCDVLPTLAALAGIPPPPWQHGEDIARVLREGRPHDAFAFSANGDPQSVNHTIYDARYRLTWYPHQGFVELFDHLEDPGETRNIAALPAQRERVADLKRRINDQLAASYNPILARVAAW